MSVLFRKLRVPRPGITSPVVSSQALAEPPYEEIDEAAVPERSRDFNQSLARGLEIIESFDVSTTHQTVSQVATRIGLSRASARRFLLTLVELDYMATDGRNFWLSPRVLGLGYSFLSGLGFANVALPRLERLVADVDECSEAAILDGDDIVYVVRVPGTKLMTIAITVGSRMPAHATSMGHVLLAGLTDDELGRYLATAKLERFLQQAQIDRSVLRDRILAARDNGYAIVDSEIEQGLIAVAVPIHDRVHRVVAAVSFSTHAGRHNADSVRRELLPPLQQTAALIEQHLGNV